jgi:hypothetical protein
MECVKDDMKIKGVSIEMTSDRREWKKKHIVLTSYSGGNDDDDDLYISQSVIFKYLFSNKYNNNKWGSME